MMFGLCILCGTQLKGYCTYNVCKDCCTHMKCPIRYTCKAYPKILEELITYYQTKQSEA